MKHRLTENLFSWRTRRGACKLNKFWSTGVSSGDRALVHSHINFAYKMVAQMTTQMIE